VLKMFCTAVIFTMTVQLTF